MMLRISPGSWDKAGPSPVSVSTEVGAGTLKDEGFRSIGTPICWTVRRALQFLRDPVVSESRE